MCENVKSILYNVKISSWAPFLYHTVDLSLSLGLFLSLSSPKFLLESG